MSAAEEPKPPAPEWAVKTRRRIRTLLPPIGCLTVSGILVTGANLSSRSPLWAELFLIVCMALLVFMVLGAAVHAFIPLFAARFSLGGLMVAVLITGLFVSAIVAGWVWVGVMGLTLEVLVLAHKMTEAERRFVWPPDPK